MSTIAILGAGASGALTAAQLLRLRANDPLLRVLLLDPRPDTARGVAYSTSDPRHRLNVRAGNMSADPSDPESFLRWVQANRAAATVATDFVPRAWFGDYLQQWLAQSITAARGSYERLRTEVLEVTAARPGYTLRLGNGRVEIVDTIVLAVGSPAPQTGWAPPELVTSPRFYADIWQPDVIAELRRTARRILLVGTGLTMVDVASSLANGGRSVTAVSRSGLLPTVHGAPVAPLAPPPLPAGRLTLQQADAYVRAHLGAARQTGADWRAAFDGLRPVTNGLWQRLPVPEQARFAAESARQWEVARHRMAPAVAADLAAAVRDQRLRIRAGRVAAVAPAPGGLRVTVAAGAEQSEFAVDAVVNCTGADRLAVRAGGLLSQLLDAGMIREHALGLGLDVDAAGRPIARDGTVSDQWYVVGPLRRGLLWETTAIPEIRQQAFAVAMRIARRLRPGAPLPTPESPTRAAPESGDWDYAI